MSDSVQITFSSVNESLPSSQAGNLLNADKDLSEAVLDDDDADSGKDILSADGDNNLKKLYMSIDEAADGDDSDIGKDILNADGDVVTPLPDMWSLHYIGVYCHYAALGIIAGSYGTVVPFCVYIFDGDADLCANSLNIVEFFWYFKIFFAVVTDLYRPWGKRRQPWMMMGWSGVVVTLIILTCFSHLMSVDVWLVMLLLGTGFMMFSDVPADGYSVEIGQLEPVEQRGQVLATGQCIRFAAGIVAGLIQMFLLNGPSTNSSDCPTSLLNCWAWGLGMNGYYGLLLAIVMALTWPIYYLKELDASHIPIPTFDGFKIELWDTLKNLNTLYIIIYVTAVTGFTNFYSDVNVFMQYYVIKLTTFQIGLDTVSTFVTLVAGVWVFKTYLIRQNWRWTHYMATLFSVLLGYLWILCYYNVGGLMNPWFTVFINLDKSFVSGIIDVLYAMAVIELAKPGLEATTYELIMTIGNSASFLNTIIATQMLYPMKTTACLDLDPGDCPSDSVPVTSESAFEDSDGPSRYTNYCLVLSAITFIVTITFVRFLPSGIDECAEWKERGERDGGSNKRAIFASVIAVTLIIYAIIAAILLMDPNTSCLKAVGGLGCQ